MKTFDDDTCGVVVGHVYAVYCQLYYNDRPQRAAFWADSYDHACLIAKEIKKRILDDMGEASYLVFPDDSLWEVKIHGAN